DGRELAHRRRGQGVGAGPYVHRYAPVRPQAAFVVRQGPPHPLDLDGYPGPRSVAAGGRTATVGRAAAVSTIPAPRGRVQSVDRAFAILDALTTRGGRASLGELASDTGLAGATVHRLCATLVKRLHSTPFLFL